MFFKNILLYILFEMLYDLVYNQRFVVQFKKLLQMHIGCMAPSPNLGSHLLYHGTTWQARWRVNKNKHLKSQKKINNNRSTIFN